MGCNGSKQLAAQQPQEQKEPVWDENKVEMTIAKVATVVFVFYAKDAEQLNAEGGATATSDGIIVGQKGVLLIEIMWNQRLNQQVQQLSKKLPNNKIDLICC
ncbi:unnamed protein product [Rotaria sp. Silwood2]|nr:unnamed protein product [Rotaria sp. Silwood2]CAF4061418.1 unnamed protein product [Rotaria sp. Silwood2]